MLDGCSGESHVLYKVLDWAQLRSSSPQPTCTRLRQGIACSVRVPPIPVPPCSSFLLALSLYHTAHTVSTVRPVRSMRTDTPKSAPDTVSTVSCYGLYGEPDRTRILLKSKKNPYGQYVSTVMLPVSLRSVRSGATLETVWAV